MKKISLVTFKEHLNNQIFLTQDPFLNIDGLLEPFRMLKQELYVIGYDLSTYDINPINESDYIFYFHIDDSLPFPQLIHREKSYFFIWECQIITPQFYEVGLHNYFAKIFTFRDDLVDNKRYFKVNYSFIFPTSIDKSVATKKKLCSLIAGNKQSKNSLELYSERVRAIRWFEKNAIDDFDLYGRGWSMFVSRSQLFSKILNKLPKLRCILERLFWHGFPSYQGEVINKKSILRQYKFSICYENARDIPGYITEKIFHCFFAGCVPVYLGASNITNYIPEGCFIDRRRFSDYEELYSYLKNMPDDEYMSYLTNIELYLGSELSYEFSADKFVNETIKYISCD